MTAEIEQRKQHYIATAEPVFDYLRNMAWIDSPSGRNSRWICSGSCTVLYCIVHTLLKNHRYGEVYG